MAISPWHLVCSSTELAAEIHALGADRGIELSVDVNPEPWREGLNILAQGGSAVLASETSPEVATLVELAATAHREKQRTVLGILEQSHGAQALRELGSDLGLTAVDDIDVLISATALLFGGNTRPWKAAGRLLGPLDRARLRTVLSSADSPGIELGSHSNFEVSLRHSQDGPWIPIGRRRAVSDAIAAIHAADPFDPPHLGAGFEVAQEVDHHAVERVLFGPRRALSDPASKAVLKPYGVPCPEEELCSSASRTASEATRMGFPVRIALASPDLRAWDHPDLVVEAVDNGARARHLFQHVMDLAKERAPHARLLGVTVSATRTERALLRVRMTPTSARLVLLQIGFADPHGMAAGDLTMSYVPLSRLRFDRMLQRLLGRTLLASEQRSSSVDLDHLYEVTHRIGNLIDEHRTEIASVEINPLAILLDGTVEIREACVTVSDTYDRALLEASRPADG
ncbi:MAG: acetate--CoA ligase family protein [Myxococcales bacterium]|nr:acetate--CoA ligase family protein [Myxococcales bacterium]MCB9708410.1 acetate--CoA ligase family protein [Myxococcales bacterium]